MKTLLTAAVLALTLSSCADKENWQSFTPPGGQCTLEMPGKTMPLNQTIPTDAGPITLHGHACEMRRGNVAYLLMWNDVPANSMATGFEGAMLEAGKANAMASMPGASEEKSSSEPYQGFPARTFTFTGKKQGTQFRMTMRMILAGDRLYQMQVVSTNNASVSQTSIDRYLSSLKINRAGGSGNAGGDNAGGETP